jgi:hypothetical protein
MLDMPELQDDPEKWWPRESIQRTVKDYVEKWKIDTVSSFYHLIYLFWSSIGW